MTLPRLAAISLLALFPAVMAAADPVTVTTARGPVTIEETPERPVVYDVAAIDSLHALGVPVAGVPQKLYVDYLDDVSKDAAKVGTLFEPDLEAVAGLGPDLIIVGGRSAAQYDSLGRIAPVIDMSVSPDVLGDAERRLKDYGALFGRQDKADELIASLQAKLDELHAAAEGRGSALILLTNGPKVAAYGANSRFGWLHTATGMPEARAGLSAENHGDAVSLEFIAEANPDWIFVIDRSAAIGEEGQSARITLDNPLVATTNAAKNGHILYLSGAGMYVAGGGYTALMQTLDQILASLNG
ncbi:siderophore ABC transporter substrate-binding protein [Sinirhodobacter populi]|uniref:Siderophore ABC transporter substrate-binding protein n=1 Tax=Paenirhodobacter populi TaxID=2306993 RepID=A0A443K6G7_9RHOB|nr:siderophore ABC transporter substrate-binding protein [Sinirhodobacter populi]RWR28273.1 siderophore ABC transporter substrate-binding protein [Sinirhodobacter populi]